MLFHRSHSFDHFGMSDYYNRKCGSLSLSKRTQSCGFRHFSVLAGSHAILPLERCVELAHTLIPHSLRNLLNGHPGGADQLLCPSEALLDQIRVDRYAVGAAKTFFQKVGETENCLQRSAMVSLSDRCVWMYALTSNRLWDTGQPEPEREPFDSDTSAQSRYSSSTDLKTQ